MRVTYNFEINKIKAKGEQIEYFHQQLLNKEATLILHVKKKGKYFKCESYNSAKCTQPQRY